MDFSPDDRSLMASDETGVTYIWDVSDLEEVRGSATEKKEQDEEDEEEVAALEEDGGKALLQTVEDPRESIKALSISPDAAASSPARSSVDPKASIKALSTSLPTSRKEEDLPPTPQTPPLTPDKIMLLVLNEMLKRKWVDESTAAVMRR